MKLPIIVSMLLTGLLVLTEPKLQAQTVAEPPSRVNVKFNAKYPRQAGKASWRQTPKGYEASFNQQGRQTVSRFTEKGDWLDTKKQMLEADLTPLMQRYLKDKHKNYRYLEGYRYESPQEKRYQFDVEAAAGRRYRLDFNGEGAFVKESPLQE